MSQLTELPIDTSRSWSLDKSSEWQDPRKQVDVARHRGNANHTTRRRYTTLTAMTVPRADNVQRRLWNPDSNEK